MFSFFKKPIPNWASCLNGKQYSAFLKALERHLQKWEIFSYQLNDNGGLALPWETSVGALKFGLDISRLAPACARIGIKEYNSVMTHSLNVFERMNELSRELDSSDFDQAKKYIGVRIYDEDYYSTAAGQNAVGGKVADGLCWMLVYDLPDAVRIISRKTASFWGVSDEELFKIGVENIRQSYPLESSPRDVDGFQGLVVTGDHFFAPNIVFEMETHPELLGRHGALFGIPYRNAVLIYPFENGEVISKIQTLIHLSFKLYEDGAGPGSISPRLYWYNNKVITDIPYQLTEDGIDIFAPEEFSELVTRLQPPDVFD